LASAFANNATAGQARVRPLFEEGEIVAAIGAELIAVKAALDRLSGKTAWQRWLKDHVHYSLETAQNECGTVRRKKRKRFRFFRFTDASGDRVFPAEHRGGSVSFGLRHDEPMYASYEPVHSEAVKEEVVCGDVYSYRPPPKPPFPPSYPFESHLATLPS